MNTGLSLVLAAALITGAAHAAEIVDQAQTMTDFSSGVRGIGGGSEQKLAQTFTAGVTGSMVAIRAPILGCAGGELVLEVRLAGAGGAPDGALLNTTRVPPESVPASLETRALTFTAPKEAASVPGVATIRFGQQTWTIDTTIPADAFADGPLARQDLPKGLPKKP